MTTYEKIEAIIDELESKSIEILKTANRSDAVESRRGGELACTSARAFLDTFGANEENIQQYMIHFTEHAAKRAANKYNEIDADPKRAESLRNQYLGMNTYNWELHERIAHIEQG